MNRKILLVFFLIIFILNFSDGKIILINEPQEIYSFGDLIYIDFYIEKDSTSMGYLQAVLACDQKELIIFKKAYTVQANEKTNFSFNAFADEQGDCRIKITFGGDATSTGKFTISDKITINSRLNNKFFLPGEKLIINGTAIKFNGNFSEGIAEIFLSDLFYRTIEIQNGYFHSEFLIPENSAPGNHTLVIKVADKENNGLFQENIGIKSKPFSIDINANDSVKPPENLTILVRLLDQVGNFIESTSLLVRIFDPDDNLVLEKTILSGEEIILSLMENATRGSWKINSYYGKIFYSYPVYILENKQISFQLIHNPAYVKVTNIGNTEYNGIIEIFAENDSSNYSIPLNVNLSIGESKNYPLSIKGEYNLTIQGNEFKNVKITGAAISLNSGIKSNPFVILTIFVLLLFVVLFLVYRKRFFRYLSKNRKKETSPEEYKEKNIFVVFFNSNEQNLIEKLVKKIKYPFHKVSDSLSFLIIYSSDFSVKDDLLLLSKKIIKKSKKSSILLHCEKFQGKMSSINSALTAKNIVKHINGLYMTENFYALFNNFGYKSKKEIILNEKNIKIYEVGF